MAVDNVSLIDAIANDKENACLVLLITDFKMAMIEIHFKYDITDNCQKFLQVVQDQLGQIGIKIKAQIS